VACLLLLPFVKYWQPFTVLHSHAGAWERDNEVGSKKVRTLSPSHFRTLNPEPQDSSLPGTSEKLRKGKTGKEAEQTMPFACMMGQACGSMNGELTCGNLKSGFTVHGSLFTVDGIVKSYAFPCRSMGTRENILSAGKGKTEKANQSLPVKGKGIAESSHCVILKGEAMKDIKSFMNASKGRRTKTNRLFSDMINLLPKRDGQKQIKGKVENLPGSIDLKKNKAEINHVLTGDVKGLLKPGLNKQSIESGLTKSGLIKAVVGKNEVVKENRSLRTADTVGQNFRTEKIAVAISKEGGFKESWAGINNALVKGRRSGVRGQRSELARRQFGGVRSQKAEMEERQGLLKSGLKNAVVVKGKIVVESDKTEKNSFILAKNDGGKNEIKDILRHLGLKSGETMEILHRKISSPSHSIDKISSAGGYQHTALHSGGSSAAVNESAGSSGIEPRVLINQIASAAKRSGRVRITLNPPRLGTLDMNVLVRDNKVHVMLQVENNDVRQVLQSNIESLKSSLRNHGLVADTINVSVQEKSDSTDYGTNDRSGQNETLFKEGGKREGSHEDHEGEQNFLNHNPLSFEEENQGVRPDGRVSLFA